MATPREQIQQAVDAGHPDTALVAVPIGVLRQILAALPIDALTALGGAASVRAGAPA